jgi:hypothetical protein
MIIGINGKIGVGKDTVGTIIQYLKCYNTGNAKIEDVISNPYHEWWLEEQSGFEIKKFAGKLKQIASILTGIPVEKFEDQEFKKTTLSEEWDFADSDAPDNIMTIRMFLQKLGTEAMRDGLHTNVWVNALFSDISSKDNIIITDMRFPNEMEAVKSKGGITIRVMRPGTSTREHYSEIAIDDAKFDYEIINDAGIPELIEKVREILVLEELI